MKRTFYLMAICVCLLFSCKMESDLDPVIPDQDLGLSNLYLGGDKDMDRFLELYGLKNAEVQDLGKFYFVDNCILANKDKLLSGVYDINSDKKGNENAQVRTTALVSSSAWNYKLIKVKIDNSIPSSGVDNWRPEIEQALEDLNDVKNFRLKFELVSSGDYDILIKSDVADPIPYNAIAGADWPSSGLPGSPILINLDYTNINDPSNPYDDIYNWTVPSAVKRRNIVHEIGHCIGYRHTNYEDLNEGPGSIGQIYVPGTFTTDPNSVMNGGTANTPWSGFSPFDILTCRTIYNYDWGEVPLFTYRTSHGGNLMSHHWSGDWYEYQNYSYQGFTGFFYQYQKSGTVPLYRYNHTTGLDYISIDSNIPNIDSAFTLDKIIGYVYNSSNSENIPVYEWYHPNEGHYFTTNSNEGYVSGAGWVGGGVAFYVESFY